MSDIIHFFVPIRSLINLILYIMDKLGYFAFTALILGFVLIIASCEIEETNKTKLASVLAYVSFTMFGLFAMYVIYLWISLFFTL